jgi:hypothetical protein
MDTRTNGQDAESIERQCQLRWLTDMGGHPSWLGVVWQRRNRLRRFLKRRWTYLRNWSREIVWGMSGSQAATNTRVSNQRTATSAVQFQAGDEVLVKSREEVQATLDRWNQLKGCVFLEEMWKYCGTRQRVLKPVKRFLDERDYLIKSCRGLVILEGVICEGTKDFGPCDRCCFLFWRQEWLTKQSP